MNEQQKQWEVIRVKPTTRKQKIADTDELEDVDYTLVLMRDQKSGDYKTWLALGKWTLEDLKCGVPTNVQPDDQQHNDAKPANWQDEQA